MQCKKTIEHRIRTPYKATGLVVNSREKILKPLGMISRRGKKKMMYDTHRFFATIPKNVISSIVLALERSERAYITTKLFFI